MSHGEITLMEIFLSYSRYEPHVFMLANLLRLHLERCQGDQIVSLGIDGMKEYLLAEALPQVRIHGVDSDGAFVAGCQVCFPHPRLSWGTFDLLSCDYAELPLADIAILSQMTYQFTDAQLRAIFERLASVQVPEILVLSPRVVAPSPLELASYVKHHLAERGAHSVKYTRTLAKMSALVKPWYQVREARWYSLPFHRVALLHLAIRTGKDA